MWFALDLDRTLIDDHEVPFPEVVEILNFIQEQGYDMTVVSYNLNVEEIVTRLGWDSYFRKVICDRNRTKAQIIKDISTELQLKAGDAVLIDDLDTNVHTCIEAGIHAVLVNASQGFQLTEAQQLLQYHQLPVIWLAALPFQYHKLAQDAFKGYFVRYYASHVDIDELIVYARDNSKPATIVGALHYHADHYGEFHSIIVQDVETGKHSYMRSASIPQNLHTALSVGSGRITITDVLSHLFVLCIEHLEHEVREHHYQQFGVESDPELGDSTSIVISTTSDDLVTDGAIPVVEEILSPPIEEAPVVADLLTDEVLLNLP